MQFGEKLKKLRKAEKLTQADLAKKAGVSLRTIASYEMGNSYPRYRAVYEALADALNTDVDFLRSETEEFMEEVGQKFGNRGQQQAQRILGLAGEMFSGGELSEEDQIAFLTEMQQLFLDSKKRSLKFTPKKYRKDENDDTH